MREEKILKKLQEAFNLNINNIPAHELSLFLVLVEEITDADLWEGIHYVLTRKKLEQKTAWDKFKYLCGYLQKVRKAYFLKESYRGSHKK